jgi:cell division septation protein DedD
MPWLPKGNTYAFCENSIEAYAPQVSGVYGIYNFDYQLYIGESSNIRAALQQHLSETERQPLRFQPTGFAFEPCSAEMRAVKAQHLIEEHQPVRQAEWPAADSWEAGPVHVGPLSDDFRLTAEEAPRGDNAAMEASEIPAAGKRFYFATGQFTALVVLFVLSLAVVFFLGVLTGESLHKRAGAGNESRLASFSEEPGFDPPGLKGLTAADGSQFIDEIGPTAISNTTNVRKSQAQVNNREHNNANGIVSAQRNYAVSAPLMQARAAESYSNLGTNAEAPSLIGIAHGQNRETPWTVQLAANREKTLSEKQVAELKAKGYEAYLVEREREGQIWYRVRVGRFNTRAEADALRGVLESREGYRSPFLTRE